MNIKFQVFVSLLAALFGMATSSNGDEETVRRFFSEAPIAWQESSDIYDQTTFTLNKTTWRALEHDKGDTILSVAEIEQLGEFVRQTGKQVYADGDSHEFFHISNDAYQASLELQRGKPFIDSIEHRPRAGSLTDAFFAYGNSRPSFCFFQSCLYDSFEKIDSFHRNRNALAFIVKDAVSTTNENGEEIIVLQLAKSTLNEQGEFAGLDLKTHSSQITLELIPSRNWCIYRFTEVGSAHAVVDGNASHVVPFRIDCEYEFVGDSCHPCIKSETVTMGGRKQKQKWECSELRESDVELNDFHLASFGIPEPSPNSSGIASSNRVFFPLGFGLASLVSFVVFWLLRR